MGDTPQAPIGTSLPQTHSVATDTTGVFQVPAEVEINLAFKFLDPTGKARYFPPAFQKRVRIRYKDDSTEEYTASMSTGAVSFETKRSMGWFTVEFEFDETLYIVNEPVDQAEPANMLYERARAEEYADPRKQAAADVSRVRTESGDEAATQAQEFYKTGDKFGVYRVFELPRKITLKNADWKVDSKHYDASKFAFDLEKDKPKKIGTESLPVTLTLDPHWQYVKFEYFDRYYGHTDHSNKPISVLPLMLEGYEGEPGKLDPPPDPPQWKSRSNWVIAKDAKYQDAIQCLPWIIQRSDDGATPKPKPDATTTLRFVTDDDHRFIKSSAADKREFAKLADTDADAKPCANRLRYYDLPAVWKSRKYWCRQSDVAADQDFFEEMIKRPTTKNKSLIFSLDDIVLVEHNKTTKVDTPLTLDAKYRAAVFYHRFKKQASGGECGRAGAEVEVNGLYKPGPTRAGAIAAGKKAGADAEKARQQSVARTAGETEQRRTEEDNARRTAVDGVTSEERTRIRTEAEAAQRVAEEAEAKRETVKNPPPDVNEPEISYTLARFRLDEAIKKAQKNLSEEARAAITKAGEDAVAQHLKTVGDKAVEAFAGDAGAQQRIRDEGERRASAVAIDNGLVATAETNGESTATQEEDAATGWPYSKVKLLGANRNYLADYPHWTRLVVVKGNLFEAFNLRTEQDLTKPDDATRVVGARAALRWEDSPSLCAAGTELKPRPPATRKTYFAIQPFFSHEFDLCREYRRENTTGTILKYQEWASPHTDSRDDMDVGGRCDAAALRCCDREGDEERAAVLTHIRLSFTFESGGTNASENNNETKQANFIQTGLESLNKRWTGPDGGHNPGDIKIEPRDKSQADCGYSSRFVFLTQHVEENLAHLKVKVVHTGRSSMNATKGTGQLRDPANQPDGRGNFSFAHEMGHVLMLEDEYTETQDVASYSEWGLRMHMPGDPFIDDEESSVGSMMHENIQPRNRHFWPFAEWWHSLYDHEMQVDYGGNQYKIEHHPNNVYADPPTVRSVRTYAFFPRAVTISADNLPALPDGGQPDRYDLYLYQLGIDYFSKGLLVAECSGCSVTDFDGILVATVGVELEFHDTTDHTRIKSATSTFASRIMKQSNFKWRGSFKAGTLRAGGDFQFQRCLLYIQPRVLVATLSEDAGYRDDMDVKNQGEYDVKVTDLRDAYVPHLKVNISSSLTALGVTSRAIDTSTTPPTVAVTLRTPEVEAIINDLVAVARAALDAFVMDGSWEAGSTAAMTITDRILGEMLNAAGAASSGADAVADATAVLTRIATVHNAILTEQARASAPAPTVASLAAEATNAASGAPEDQIGVLLGLCASNADLVDMANLSASIGQVLSRVLSEGTTAEANGGDQNAVQKAMAIAADAMVDVLEAGIEKLNSITPADDRAQANEVVAAARKEARVKFKDQINKVINPWLGLPAPGTALSAANYEHFFKNVTTDESTTAVSSA